MAYEINYNDDRFKQVETDKNAALSDLEETYAGMVKESDKYYQAQIDASKEWATEQQKLQQEKTDFAIEQIEQQKDQTEKEYIREQSGAYVDWQKESNRYGANAEQMASQGLANSGYSESSQVSMYNTYQNRVATARESYNLAVLNYNNAIKDARLQNNSVLAEIAYQALQQQLELSLQGFQYKNQLLAEKTNQKTQIMNRYDNRYQAVLDQMNKENALQEEFRQYNAPMAAENSSAVVSSKKVVNNKQTNAQRIAADNPQVKTQSNNTKVQVSREGYKDAGINAGQITNGSASAFGLSNDSRIVTKNGKYYAVEGDALVDVSFSKPVINMLKNFVPSIK